MTPTQVKALAELRADGYAVITFTPDELRGLEPRVVENRLVELGNEVIDVLAPEKESDDGT